MGLGVTYARGGAEGYSSRCSLFLPPVGLQSEDERVETWGAPSPKVSAYALGFYFFVLCSMCEDCSARRRKTINDKDL